MNERFNDDAIILAETPMPGQFDPEILDHIYVPVELDGDVRQLPLVVVSVADDRDHQMDWISVEGRVFLHFSDLPPERREPIRDRLIRKLDIGQRNE